MARKITAPAKMAVDSDFRDRALIAAIQEALDVVHEDPATPNHAFRAGYAQSLLKSPEAYQSTIAWVLASAFGMDPTFQNATPGDIPDEAMAFVFHQHWTLLSAPA